MFSKGGSFIDTEVHKSSGSEAFVRRKLDFGNIEHMKTFHKESGDWEVYNYKTSKVVESTETSVLWSC